MARPTAATGTVRPELMALANEFMQKDTAFIASQILPYFEVDHDSATYPVIPIEALLADPPETKRAPRSAFHRDDWNFETDTYNCVEHGHEEPVDEVEAKMYERFFDAEEVALYRAVAVILRAREKRTAAIINDTGNFTNSAVTHEWDDATNAVPADDVNTARNAIHSACGVEPNVLVISRSTFYDLGMCDQIVDRIKYTNPAVDRGQINADLLAQFFGVDKVHVGQGLKNTAKKGQTAVPASIWSNEYAFLGVASAARDLKTPSVGRTFRWNKIWGEEIFVESYIEEQTDSTIIRAREYVDEELIVPGSGYLLTNITT